MEVILTYLPMLIPTVIAVAALAYFASRTRFTTLLTVIEGVTALFVFCFFIRAGASLDELLLVISVLLLPSMLLRDRGGRGEK